MYYFRKLNILSAFIFITFLLTQCAEPQQEVIEKEHQIAEETVSFLSGFSYTGKFLDISAETENARATHWKPDGSVVFITGRYTNNVAAYTVDDPWDISTATFQQAVEVQGEFQHGLFFKADGKRMWIFDRTSIWTYNLSNAWDISAIADTSNTDVSDFVERGHDIDFKPEGSYLFIDDRNTGAVFSVKLNQAWDISTGELEYTLDISDIQKEIRGIEFIKEGSIMIMMDTGRDELLEFHLETAYDISTARLISTFDVSEQTYQGRGLSFSKDLSSFYVTGRDEQKIFQYSVQQ